MVFRKARTDDSSIFPFLSIIRMATRSPATLPANLQEVLQLRASSTACRKDVVDAMSNISFFNPPKAKGTRFQNLAGTPAPDGWRAKEEDEWTSVRKRPGPPPPRRYGSSAPYIPAEDSKREVKEGVWRASRFKPIDAASETTMEDRIMGKVRAKVNKIGASTFDATKAFMQQILDSGEKDFLEEFMRFVFQKAATETAFCGLYARLLHELADEFEHLRHAMQFRFREYIRIFDEMAAAPDVGTADYKAFVEAQEQKKFRRGYSQFVAELAKLGEVSMQDFRTLVGKIIENLMSCYVVEANKVLCEELVDCFSAMWKANPSLFKKQEWVEPYVTAMRLIVDTPRESAPGLSNKARFGLMDVLDLATKVKK